jgi:hypothetical protein
MANLRFETAGEGKPIMETVVADTDVPAREFKSLMRVAQEPSADFTRQALRSLLMPKGAEGDREKTVFFRDIAFYDILPAAVGHDTAVVLGTESVKDGLARRKVLAQKQLSPDGFTAILGYPENESDYSAVFQRTDAFDLKTWQQHSESFVELAKKYSLDLYQGSRLRELNDLGTLLAAMEEAKGIVLVTAHANGCKIMLQNQSFTITPGQIGRLKFRNSPFVVLRICNEMDTGFTRAFLQAGASGVWKNSGKIDAGQANKEIGNFLQALKDGNPILPAIQKSSDSVSHFRNGIFTEDLNPTYKNLVWKLTAQNSKN